MAQCVSRVQLSVNCRRLLDRDVGSKSDPLCVLLQDVGGCWAEVRPLGARGCPPLQARRGAASPVPPRLPSPSAFIQVPFIFVPVSVQLDRTERIKNCHDPEFSKKLLVDCYFEKVQKLKFGVYDIDNKSAELSDDDFLGGMECTLGQVCEG